jgi:hypothetical protein
MRDRVQGEKNPSAAKADDHSAGLAARVNSCPDAGHAYVSIFGATEVVPLQKGEFSGEI